MYTQYLSNTGYSNGYEMPVGNLKGYDIAMANPTPYARTTTTGGRRGSRRARRSRVRSRRRRSTRKR